MIELEGTLKEGLVQNNALILQVTPDHSLGADVVVALRNNLVVVDGPGSGVSGRRREAVNLLSTLLKGVETPALEGGTFISIELNDHSLMLKARAGCYGIAYVVDSQSGMLWPEMLYAGDDGDSQTITIRRNLEDVRYILLLTDGGVDLLAHPELFGDRPEFRGTSSKILVDDLIFAAVSSGYIPRAFETILLPPLTAILNESVNDQPSNSGLDARFRTFQAKMLQMPKSSLPTDDATLVLAPLSGNSS